MNEEEKQSSSSESDAPLTKTRGPGRPKNEKREPQEKVNKRKVRSENKLKLSIRPGLNVRED